MQAFSGYDEAQTQEYGERREKLKLGGHICKILEVRTEAYTSKDGKPFEMLVMKIDIEEPDEQAGFYTRRFKEEAEKDAMNAKWKGYYRLTVPTDSSEDYVKSKFKTFTTSIEKSNPGYKWNWQEATLVGKVFGGIFALKQIELTQGMNAGKIVDYTELRFARSTEKVAEVEIPNVRLLDGTYMSYDDYLEMKEEKGDIISDLASKGQPVDIIENDNDDLPF